ncbi:MAG: minor capsid protein [Candidatus Cloacimonetes bacterium]|nr:minor capsid protein [Candidatus Cloacimonadota bacterium]
MKNSSNPNEQYWKKRFEALEDVSNKKGQAIYGGIEDQYKKAQSTIEGKLLAWYQRFADNNNITMAEARKILSTKELAELKWDVNEYIKYGQTNALDGAWMKQLENASARFHISRLEALKIQAQQAVEVLYGNQLDSLDKLARNIYTEGYYHTAFEIQKGFNVGYDIASIDNNRLEKIISKPWAADGKNFSSRIWSNKSNLVNELHTQLTQTVMIGKSPDEAIKAISKKFNTSKNNAGKLIMTESAYFASASQKDCFNDLDVERFEIVATLDSHTSAICQDLDGQIYEMKDYEPGVTAPPFHVWCRSTTVPYFEDNYTERAARDEDGKTYYVPGDMKYKDWKESFVDGGSKDGLQDASQDGIMKVEDEYINKFKSVVGRVPTADEMNYLDTDFDNYFLLGSFPEKNIIKYTDVKKAFNAVSLNGITDAGYKTVVENELLRLANTYPIGTEDITIRMSSAKKTFGTHRQGFDGDAGKIKYINEIAYSKIYHTDLKTCNDSHYHTLKVRNSKLLDVNNGLTTISHEYGHAIDNMYAFKTQSELDDLLTKYKMATAYTRSDISNIEKLNGAISSDGSLSNIIFKKLKEKYKCETSELWDMIKDNYGSYAYHDKAEFLAEAFSNMQNLSNEQKTDFIKDFDAVFNEEFNRVFKGV